MRKLFFRVIVAAILIILVIFVKVGLWRKKNTDEVYLVAIRYSHQENFGFQHGKTPRLVFIRLNGRDPDPTFLGALQIPMLDARPGSRANGIQKLHSGDAATDRITNEKGIYLNFSAIRWNYPVRKTYDPMMGEASVWLESKVEIQGLGLTTGYSDYELSRRDGHWEVIDRAHSVVS